MDNIKTILYMLFNNVYMPEEVVNRKEKIILHISDTPACFFSSLRRIINKIKPEYIIHTGDMVDDIKLGCNSMLLPEYRKKVKILLGILEDSHADKIYISLGNHDHLETVNEICRRSIIIEKSKNIKIENLNLRISHYPEEILKNPIEYNLYGHNVTLESKKENEKIYLNGIMNVNIIKISKKEVLKFPYPFGTDDVRLKKGKIGL